jgi:alpha-beta hydrolase superfamily lysophospholipase
MPLPEALQLKVNDDRILHGWAWPAPSETVGQLLLVHGLGEHARRYDRLANTLWADGWHVLAYDQLGHGQSPGPRGDLPFADALVEDLAAVYGQWGSPELPRVVLGHSLGGLVVADWISGRLSPHHKPVGIVLSSPALGAKTNLIQRFLLATLPKIFPHLCVANGVNPALISHDATVVKQYRADPLVHNRIAALLAAWIIARGSEVQQRASDWRTPTLVQYAGDDYLVDAEATWQFIQNSPAGVVTGTRFEGAYHEVYNELSQWREPAVTQLLGALRGFL